MPSNTLQAPITSSPTPETTKMIERLSQVPSHSSSAMTQKPEESERTSMSLPAASNPATAVQFQTRSNPVSSLPPQAPAAPLHLAMQNSEFQTSSIDPVVLHNALRSSKDPASAYSALKQRLERAAANENAGEATSRSLGAVIPAGELQGSKFVQPKLSLGQQQQQQQQIDPQPHDLSESVQLQVKNQGVKKGLSSTTTQQFQQGVSFGQQAAFTLVNNAALSSGSTGAPVASRTRRATAIAVNGPSSVIPTKASGAVPNQSLPALSEHVRGKSTGTPTQPQNQLDRSEIGPSGGTSWSHTPLHSSPTTSDAAAASAMGGLERKKLEQAKLAMDRLRRKKARLAEMPNGDIQGVLQPDFKTPFSGLYEAWERLLPYHMLLANEEDDEHKLWDEETGKLAVKYRGDLKNMKRKWHEVVDSSYKDVLNTDEGEGFILSNEDALTVERILLNDCEETVRREMAVARQRAAEHAARVAAEERRRIEEAHIREAQLREMQRRAALERSRAIDDNKGDGDALGIGWGGNVAPVGSSNEATIEKRTDGALRSYNAPSNFVHPNVSVGMIGNPTFSSSHEVPTPSTSANRRENVINSAMARIQADLRGVASAPINTGAPESAAMNSSVANSANPAQAFGSVRMEVSPHHSNLSHLPVPQPTDYALKPLGEQGMRWVNINTQQSGLRIEPAYEAPPATTEMQFAEWNTSKTEGMPNSGASAPVGGESGGLGMDELLNVDGNR